MLSDPDSFDNLLNLRIHFCKFDLNLTQKGKNMAGEETQTLEQTLEKTDFGHVINENKKGILIGAAVLVLLISAYSIWNYQSNKSYENNLTQVYTFKSEVVDSFVAGKLTEADFLTKINSLPAHLKGQATLIPSLFKAIDKLTLAGKNKEAVAILEGWTGEFNKGSYNFFFIAMKLAPMYENAGEVDKAIALTQKLIASNIEVSKAQNYLNLGRLYMQKNDNAKAKESFDFILKNHDKSQAAKLAKLYLQSL